MRKTEQLNRIKMAYVVFVESKVLKEKSSFVNTALCIQVQVYKLIKKKS